MLIVEAQIRCSMRMRPDQNWPARFHHSAALGHSARITSTLHSASPMKKPICQKRPSWI